jgi:hypothetical protein
VIGRVLRVAVPVLLLLVVGGGLWFAFTGSRALAAVRDLEDAVVRAQQAVDDTDVLALETAAKDAQEAAARAADAVNGPLWAAVATIPYVGDTPELARTTAGALATAADGLTPLLEVSGVLDPASLYSDGRIDVQALRAASSPLTVAATTLTTAADEIATAPTAEEGAWVPAALDAQRAQAETRLSDAADALSAAAVATDVLPGLLGADGTRIWFVGLQSPAEARGTGGLAGNYVTLTADDGVLTLVRTGSNSDFRMLPQLPDVGEDYVARYGQDPRLFTNGNVSPDFPTAGLLWSAFYADTFGATADVVAGVDVAVLGALTRATGPVTLLDGTVLAPDEVVPFFLSEVYEAYPDRDERKRVQEAAAESVFVALTTGDVDAATLVSEFAQLSAEGRVQLWSPVESEESSLATLGLAGSLATDTPHSVYPVVINASGSKLDVHLDRDITYTVGRCPADGRVVSTVDVTLTAELPDPLDVDPFVLGQSTGTPEAPTQRTQLQLHVAPGAEIIQANVDGEPVSSYAFTEQGRPSALVELDLVARQPVTVTFVLDEPAGPETRAAASSDDSANDAIPDDMVDDAAQHAVVGQVEVQPLARPPTVAVVDGSC